MGEAIQKESDMEDILASIRKIISSETASEAASETPEKSTVKPDKNLSSNDGLQDGNITKAEGHIAGKATKSDLENSENAAHLQIQERIAYKTDPVRPLDSSDVEENTVLAPISIKKTPQKSKMSNTLDSIRAVVTRNSSKTTDTKEVVADTAISKPEMPKMESASVSTSATPLASLNTPLVPTKTSQVEKTMSAVPIAKPEDSLSKLVEQVKNNGSSSADMVYSNPEPQPEIKAPNSDENSANASEVNFKNFAQSVQKPNVPAQPPSDFVKDDVGVFVKVDDNQAEALNPTEELTESNVSIGKLKIEDAPKVETQSVDTEKPRTEISDAQTIIEELARDEDASNIAPSQVTSDMLRGPIRNNLSEPISATVPESIAHDVTRSVKDILKGSAQEVKEAETDKFKDALVSPATKIAVAGSIDRLKQSLDDVNTAHVENVLRPMLREWLDNNLPNMVEKIVSEEISRITQQAEDTK